MAEPTFSACNPSCGPGTQTRGFLCTNYTNGNATVAESNCNGISKPANQSQSCNNGACPPNCNGITCSNRGTCSAGVCTCMNSVGNNCQFSWMFETSFTACNSSCGPGTQTRGFRCTNYTNGNATVADANCNGISKPANQSQSCNNGACPPTCSGITCSNRGTCSAGVCTCTNSVGNNCQFSWMFEPTFTACNPSCGSGTQTRGSRCTNYTNGNATVADANCNGITKSANQSQSCNNGACPPSCAGVNCGPFGNCNTTTGLCVCNTSKSSYMTIMFGCASCCNRC